MLKVFTFFIISNSFLFTQNLNNQIQLNVIEDIKLFHSPPEPLFTGRPFELSLVTELSESIIHSTLLFFKTDSMESFREINLEGKADYISLKLILKIFQVTL